MVDLSLVEDIGGERPVMVIAVIGVRRWLVLVIVIRICAIGQISWIVWNVKVFDY